MPIYEKNITMNYIKKNNITTRKEKQSILCKHHSDCGSF